MSKYWPLVPGDPDTRACFVLIKVTGACLLVYKWLYGNGISDMRCGFG